MTTLSTIDLYGGTVVQREETGYVVAHVEPLQFDALTPVLLSFNDYESYATLSTDEAVALRDALTLALTRLGE